VQVRHVRCPYCKTVVKVPAASEAGREALEAMSDMIAAEKAGRALVPATVRHRVAPPPRGVRNRAVIAVWLSLLGVGLVAGGIGIYWLYGRGGDTAPGGASATKSAKDGAPAEAPKAGAKSPAATPGAKDAAPPPPVPEESVTVKVERLLGGFKDETITYAVGHVKNNTSAVLRAVKMNITIADKDDKELGEATQMILNLPPGATAPLVAEWVHAEGVIGRRWFPGYALNPKGVPQELPAVVCEDALAIRDPNAMSTTGKIRVRVTNQGALPLPQVQLYAILLAQDGKIIGAAKSTVDQQLPSKKAVDVTFPWTNCGGHQVQSVEVWAQAGL
jgi:hypothetical protein